MEEYIKYLKFKPSSENSINVLQTCKSVLLKKPGILEVSEIDHRIVIGFNTYSISEEELTTSLTHLGLDPYPAKVKKGLFASWIDNLAKTNQENFGDKRLDCCDMNNSKIKNK